MSRRNDNFSDTCKVFAETIAMTKMNKNNDVVDLTYLKAVVLLSVRTRSGVGGAS